MLKCSNRYDDIINLPHPTSANHPPMDVANRAAQFSPFAALTGYEAALEETARLTEERIELSEDEKAVLDEKMQGIQGQLVTITYYVPDERKAGGAYRTITDVVKRVDAYEGKVIMQDGEKIVVRDIIEIEEQ